MQSRRSSLHRAVFALDNQLERYIASKEAKKNKMWSTRRFLPHCIFARSTGAKISANK